MGLSCIYIDASVLDEETVTFIGIVEGPTWSFDVICCSPFYFFTITLTIKLEPLSQILHLKNVNNDKKSAVQITDAMNDTGNYNRCFTVRLTLECRVYKINLVVHHAKMDYYNYHVHGNGVF